MSKVGLTDGRIVKAVGFSDGLVVEGAVVGRQVGIAVRIIVDRSDGAELKNLSA